MGSSGGGRISDYSGSKGGSNKGGGGGGSGGGPLPPAERCGRAFSVELEDVEHSDFFAANGTQPSVGTPLRIRKRKRLVAETLDGVSVGNIPTSHNYLADCIEAGWDYMGQVTVSSSGPPVASVVGDFAAIAP
jgi:hypothetical protein